MVMNALDPFLSQTVTLDKLKVLEIKPRKGKLEKLKIGNSEMFLYFSFSHFWKTSSYQCSKRYIQDGTHI